MIKEDIVKAAKEEAEKLACLIYYGGSEISKEDVENACVNIAEWRINSVWHSNTEVPNRTLDAYYCGENVLIQTIDGKLNFGIVNYGYGYNGKMFYTIICMDRIYTMDEIKRWAYIKDLMPIENL